MDVSGFQIRFPSIAMNSHLGIQIGRHRVNSLRHRLALRSRWPGTEKGRFHSRWTLPGSVRAEQEGELGDSARAPWRAWKSTRIAPTHSPLAELAPSSARLSLRSKSHAFGRPALLSRADLYFGQVTRSRLAELVCSIPVNTVQSPAEAPRWWDHGETLTFSWKFRDNDT